MNELIVFRLSEERYGIDVARVREIQTFETPTPLPNTQPFVKGVINIRGEIVPVIDLLLRFDPTFACSYTDKTPVVTTRTSDNRMIAIIVDAVESLETYDPEQLIELGGDMHFINREFLRGIATIDARHVTVIDVDAMFSPDEIAAY